MDKDRLKFKWVEMYDDIEALDIIDTKDNSVMCSVTPRDVKEMGQLRREVHTYGIYGILDWICDSGYDVEYYVSQLEEE